jgi:S-adenosylmethionine synthetase
VVISTQHSESVDHKTLSEYVREEIIKKVVPAGLLDNKTKFHINPTGRFVVGGPMGDSGLTGRKIIVDTYGGMGRHGGGAFSGKDPSKVDRSAAYYARYIAKNLVASRLCTKAEVQLAYAIGVAAPVSIAVDTFGTGKLSDDKLEAIVERLRRPPGERSSASSTCCGRSTAQTAAYGHFGRHEPEFTWERTDRAEKIAAPRAE